MGKIRARDWLTKLNTEMFMKFVLFAFAVKQW